MHIPDGILDVQTSAIFAGVAAAGIATALKGARTQLDVLNAQQQYTLALRDLAQARFVYLMSKVKLSALAGEDAVSSVDQVNAALVVQ